MGKSDKQPSLQFYPGDWKKDPAVTCLSLASKGLWLEMLLLMFESPERGYLKHLSGHPIGDEQLARMVGASVTEVRKCLAEMKLAGTYSLSEDGSLFCRRMVRDERIRQLRREAGKLGGNPKLANKVGDLVKQNGKQIPTPSSSASAALSSSASASALWPLAAAAIRERFPTADDRIIFEIVTLAKQAAEEVEDSDMPQVIAAATRPNQKSPALYRNTVPTVVKSWR